MKVLALVILVIGSTSGSGSGPYLPSGWKPSGPAFYLPTEVEKPVTIPLKDVPVQETESSGSSFLREYGPPAPVVRVEETEANVQQVSQDFTQQALPDEVTDQAFVVIEAKFNQDETNAEVKQQAVDEQVSPVTETGTESLNIEEQTTQSEALVEGTDIETQTESSLAAEEVATEKTSEVTGQAEKVVEVEAITQDAEVVTQEAEAITQEAEVAQEEIKERENENSNSNNVAFEQKTERVTEVETVEEGVKNIAEAIVNIESEIKAKQVQIDEEIKEMKTIIETKGSLQNEPQGFLEYGPPGFTEYGPPKKELIKATAAAEDNASYTNEITENRRRRFSPKFKTPKRKH